MDFGRLRRRIVAAIMGVLAVLVAGTFAIIYAASSAEVHRHDVEMLESYSRMELQNDRPQEIGKGQGLSQEQGQGLGQGQSPAPAPTPAPPETQAPDAQAPQSQAPQAQAPEGAPDPTETPAFKLSTFYSVLLSQQGEVLQVKNSDEALLADSELEEKAQRLAASGATDGTDGSLAYLVTRTDSATLVAFMDKSAATEGASSLLRNTFLFGGICLVLFFFLSVILARRMVAPLQKSYEEQTRFVADAGHELKTPVSVIGANAELLSRQIGPNQWLDNIMFENERMGRLVAGLLDLDKAAGSAQEDDAARETVDLSKLVQGEVLLFEGVAFEKGKSIAADVEEGLAVEGDPLKLRQLASILIDNAVGHSPEGSEVQVRLSRTRDSAQLSVLNPGDLSQENASRVFDRFYRTDASRGGGSGHYGLGLSIARAIASAHGGTIEVHTAPAQPGAAHGTVTFLATLPLARQFTA